MPNSLLIRRLELNRLLLHKLLLPNKKPTVLRKLVLPQSLKLLMMLKLPLQQRDLLILKLLLMLKQPKMLKILQIKLQPKKPQLKHKQLLMLQLWPPNKLKG
jgi:hypothetical protein